MIAAFLGLRLYSVLGRRAEHEEESIPLRRTVDKPSSQQDQPSPEERSEQQLKSAQLHKLTRLLPSTEQGVRSIAAADRSFDITAFLEGAKGAYAMILEAYWSGDRDTLAELCDEEVYAGFDAAIYQREQAGEELDNRLVRIEEDQIESASLEGSIARIKVRFVADIAAVTRDKDGHVVAGSLDDAVETRDVWTFVRDVKSTDPHWLLVETDEG